MFVRSMLVASAFLLAAGAASTVHATSSPQTATARKIPATADLLARKGGDDGAKHDAGDDKGGQARRGADDGAKHDSNDVREQRQEDRGTRETESRGAESKGSDGGRSGGGSGGNRR